ncbi:hypothetical protein HDU76_007600, partial [Blyttiomyces sp. JEL0837]
MNICNVQTSKALEIDAYHDKDSFRRLSTLSSLSSNNINIVSNSNKNLQRNASEINLSSQKNAIYKGTGNPFINININRTPNNNGNNNNTYFNRSRSLLQLGTLANNTAKLPVNGAQGLVNTETLVMPLNNNNKVHYNTTNNNNHVAGVHQQHERTASVRGIPCFSSLIRFDDDDGSDEDEDHEDDSEDDDRFLLFDFDKDHDHRVGSNFDNRKVVSGISSGLNAINNNTNNTNNNLATLPNVNINSVSVDPIIGSSVTDIQQTDVSTESKCINKSSVANRPTIIFPTEIIGRILLYVAHFETVKVNTGNNRDNDNDDASSTTSTTSSSDSNSNTSDSDSESDDGDSSSSSSQDSDDDDDDEEEDGDLFGDNEAVFLTKSQARQATNRDRLQCALVSKTWADQALRLMWR